MTSPTDTQLTPNVRFITQLSDRPEDHPPVLSEMWDDLSRVIGTIAQTYTDQSCPHLHTEDLVAEGFAKLAHLIDKGWLERVPTRGQFFRVFKTAVNNHVKGLVHRHRFTMKRTGIRPPERNADGSFNQTSSKPVEISLDDPDANLQVRAAVSDDGPEQELREDMERGMTPLELMVFRQLAEPNAAALLYAELDSRRGRKPGSVKQRIRVKYAHMAEGLGMTELSFMTLIAAVRSKVELVMENKTDTGYNAAVAQLAVAFGLQIPSSIDAVVVRRLLTVAARDQVDKLTPALRELLVKIGGKPPVPIHGSDCKNATLQCFGILWKKNDRVCLSCGLYASCGVEAKNLGLDTVTLSAKLLGVKAVRTAQIVPYDNLPADPADAGLPNDTGVTETIAEDDTPAESPVVSQPTQLLPTPTNVRDEAILHYLSETFKLVGCKGLAYFRHREPQQNRLIFCVKAGEGRVEFRFCNPGDELRPRLQKVLKSWQLGENMPVAEAIALIDLHAHQTFDAQ